MWYTVKEDASYGFDLQRGFLADSPIIEETAGKFLLSGLADVGVLQKTLERLGLNAAATYFAAHVARRENVRIGDFGEVITGHLLEEEEKVTRPIEKLRYRESPVWPMKLTDVFCVQEENDRIIRFVFGEAKAGTTSPSTALGRDAYQQLSRDIQDEEPPILFFTLDRLHNSNNLLAYLRLQDAMHMTPPVPRALRLVFVFDKDCWRESVLSSLDENLNSGELTLADDFRCYVLMRDRLKEVILGAYANASRIVADG